MSASIDNWFRLCSFWGSLFQNAAFWFSFISHSSATYFHFAKSTIKVCVCCITAKVCRNFRWFFCTITAFFMPIFWAFRFLKLKYLIAFWYTAPLPSFFHCTCVPLSITTCSSPVSRMKNLDILVLFICSPLPYQSVSKHLSDFFFPVFVICFGLCR